MSNTATHALFIIDNWDGEKDQYWTFAFIKDGVFHSCENSAPIIQHVGDEILETVVLKDVEREKANQRMLSCFGDGFYSGFEKAKAILNNDEDPNDYDVLLLSEDEETFAKFGSVEIALLEKIKKLQSKLDLLENLQTITKPQLSI